MYDIAIIGAGPAGISASLYAKRSNLNVLVLYYGESNLSKATQIDNFYGFINGISGDELYKNGIIQAKKLGVDIKEIEVIGIENLGKTFNIRTEQGNFETKALILSTGNKKIKPKISGIEKFDGKGISYCAICDAFFYRKKRVAVIGNGKFAINEAQVLSNVAEKVTILTNGMEKPDTSFDVIDTNISEISGDSKVNKVKFVDESELNVDGIFIAIGEADAGDFAKTLGIVQDGNNIKVNEKMETNVKGIYACGNITGGLQQICKAVYEGAQAGISASQYVRN